MQKQSGLTLKQIGSLLDTRLDEKLDQKLKPIKKELSEHSDTLDLHTRILVDLEMRVMPMIVETNIIVKEMKDDMKKRVADLEERVFDLEPRVGVLETIVKAA